MSKRGSGSSARAGGGANGAKPHGAHKRLIRTMEGFRK
nr:MAG TPA: hypothetical protein [Caudoviricetes sp.]